MSTSIAANPTSPLLHSPLIQRLLARYLTSLALHPLRTKSITAAILFALQEVLANRLSGQHAASIRAKAQQLKGKAQSGQGVLGRLSRADVLGALGEVGVTTKAIQMAAYGGLISAPLAHFFVGFFQRMFAGRPPSARTNLLQILAMQLVQSPITALVYLASMAVINGARTANQVRATVRAGFGNVLKSMWISSPLAIAVAQKFLPQETWVVWFNVVSFVIGSYMTVGIKKRQLAMQQSKRGE